MRASVRNVAGVVATVASSERPIADAISNNGAGVVTFEAGVVTTQSEIVTTQATIVTSPLPIATTPRRVVTIRHR